MTPVFAGCRVQGFGSASVVGFWDVLVPVLAILLVGLVTGLLMLTLVLTAALAPSLGS